MTKTIAKEWGRFNIHSNAVAFGWVETRLTAAKEQGGKLVGGGNVNTSGGEIEKQNLSCISACEFLHGNLLSGCESLSWLVICLARGCTPPFTY